MNTDIRALPIVIGHQQMPNASLDHVSIACPVAVGVPLETLLRAVSQPLRSLLKRSPKAESLRVARPARDPFCFVAVTVPLIICCSGRRTAVELYCSGRLTARVLYSSGRRTAGWLHGSGRRTAIRSHWSGRRTAEK